MISKISKRMFGFYGSHISRKHGQKCCPYGQNGKPLTQENVELFLANTHNSHWKVNENYTRISRVFYFRNVFKLTEFISDFYALDADITQQIPNLSIIDRDLVKIELYTPALKGLSNRDF